MDLQQRTLRVGLTAILFAGVFRLCTMDPGSFVALLLRHSEADTPLIHTEADTETGRNVRFSPSEGVFSPNFVETPPPLPVQPPEPVLPVFSDSSLVRLQYACSLRPDIDSLLFQPLQWDLRGEEPTVLILHTHGTESYTKAGEDYRETAAYRTLDEMYNMLSIGELTARLLNEQGIPTLQDRSLHDYPSYNGSYVDARKTIREYLEEYPSIKLILDLHRDASEGTSGQLRTKVQLDGQTCAQLMVVVGANHSDYQQNLSLGLKLHAQLETQAPGITRPLQLRSQRFNQDLLPAALLIEVGAAGNARQEALLAARQLAMAVTALAEGTREAENPVQN